jgi:para-nitrobenzyl esterase
MSARTWGLWTVVSLVASGVAAASGGGCSSSDAAGDAASDTGKAGAAGESGAPLEPIQQGLEITTAEGPVKGAAGGGVRSFKGIPFAAPPVGDLRFRAPQAVSSWEQPLDATRLGAACAQGSVLSGAFEPQSSEDCLYLNVWTPDPAPASGLPVMVWFHGGAFILGSGGQKQYEGQNLAAQGAVIVTINYRLGPFGFLGHPALAAEEPGSGTGNYGLLDQRAALAWVKRNARAFGGDPGNVTIFGESAGGFSVASHLVAPGSRGLFHRAIVQSGIRPGVLLSSVEQAGAMADDLAKVVGCSAGDLACLRAVPAEKLTVGLSNPSPPPGGLFEGSVKLAVWLPVFDTVFFPEQPSQLYESGALAPVPLLLGTNKSEGALFHARLLGDVKISDEAAYAEVLGRAYGAGAAAVLGRYPASAYPSPDAALAQIETDGLFTCPARRMARASARLGSPTFRYQLLRKADGGITSPLGATHGSDLPYVFGNDDTLGSLGDDSVPLSTAMIGFWTRFARSGDPNAPASSEAAWPPFTQANEAHMALDLPLSSGAGLDGETCDFWDTMPLPTSPKTY